MGLNKLVAFSCFLLTLACAGAAQADPFSPGQFFTYGEWDWGAGGAAASLLSADYGSVFSSTSGVLIAGVTGIPGQYAMLFTSASDVEAYLPQTGMPGPLVSNLINPTTSSSGVFGGDVLSLTLDVDFNSAGFLQGSSDILFGHLLLTNFSGGLSGLNGLTVSQFLAIADTCLGNGPCPYGIGSPEAGSSANSVGAIAEDLESSFGGGAVSTFADTNLSLPGSTTPAPEPSSLLLLAPALAGLALRRRRMLHT